MNERLIAWQTSEAPKNSLVSQRLCEMQGLTSVVIATICSKLRQSYAIKPQLLGWTREIQLNTTCLSIHYYNKMEQGSKDITRLEFENITV
jgi:hypothetical protein